MHPSPGDEQPYIDYFGCPVRFGQPVNRLAFPLHLLMQPLRQPDDALLQMMERQASALLAELRQTDDLEQSVREAVARLLTQGEASLEQIAADLHVVAHAASTARRTRSTSGYCARTRGGGSRSTT